MIFVILLTPAPFSTDTKNTLIPDFLTQKNTKFMIFAPKHTNSHFFDTSTAGGAGDKYEVWDEYDDNWALSLDFQAATPSSPTIVYGDSL